jgi:hypothetical protein
MHPVHAVWGVDRGHIARMGGETKERGHTWHDGSTLSADLPVYPMRMNLAMLGVPSDVMAKSK